MAENGLTLADYPDIEVDIWPENLTTLQVYAAMSSQWRPNGSGLDYNALPVVFNMLGIKDEPTQQLAFEGLQVLEFQDVTRLVERRKKEARRNG